MRENANLRTPLVLGSVGLRGRRSILLPTKTSLLVSQMFGSLFGGSALNDRNGSQVDITRSVYVYSRLIRVVVILSSIGLMLMHVDGSKSPRLDLFISYGFSLVIPLTSQYPYEVHRLSNQDL